MDDAALHEQIARLVAEEHELREARTGAGLNAAERARIEELEVQLDQCWDLLRRRQAREEFGQDPDRENVRPASTVERYQQ